MEHENTVRLVEEEKFGWTILSTLRDGELDPLDETLAKLEQAESVVQKENDDPFTGPRDFTASNTQEEKEKQAPDEEEEGEEEEEEEGSDEEEEEDDDDGYDEHEDDYDDAGGDGDDTKAFPFGDPRRSFPWGPEQRQEAIPEFGAKQTLVQQQPGHKHGLMWSVSLIATVGFFGWAVMNGLSSGGKNLRCLKLHPCSIKEGEPVLNSL